MQKIHRRILYSFLTGLFFSILFYFGTKLLFATFSDEETCYSILDYILLIPITLAATLAFYFLYELKIKLKEDKVFSLKFWHIFIPLVASSIVIFLSIYPGHYPFDSAKMYEHFEEGSYTTHYSPLVSFVLGIFLSVGKFFGSKELGHAILIVLQLIFLNIVITKTILHCSKKLNRKRFGIIFTIFFALHPLVQTLLVRSGQDTVFGGLFLMLCLEFLKISEDENYFKDKKKKKFFYIFFLIFFLCATRNNGIYALIPAVITSIFILKKETRKRFLIAVIAPVIAFLGYNYLFIYNIVSNRDSFFLETMNVPVMQIARSMYYNPDEELEEELKTYFDEDCETWKMEKWDWGKYNLSEGISDPYKNCLKTAEIEKDPMKFFSLWQKIGSKNVKNYIEAPAVLTLGLYHPYLNYEPSWSTFQWHQYVDSYYENYDLYGINNTSILPSVRNMMSVLVYRQGWSRIPVLHLLWGAPFTVHLCLITLLITFYRRKHKYLLPLFLIFGLILTVALSPVMLFRYLFPAVIATPILIYILIRSLSSEK